VTTLSAALRNTVTGARRDLTADGPDYATTKASLEAQVHPGEIIILIRRDA